MPSEPVPLNHWLSPLPDEPDGWVVPTSTRAAKGSEQFHAKAAWLGSSITITAKRHVRSFIHYVPDLLSESLEFLDLHSLDAPRGWAGGKPWWGF